MTMTMVSGRRLLVEAVLVGVGADKAVVVTRTRDPTIPQIEELAVLPVVSPLGVRVNHEVR